MSGFALNLDLTLYFEDLRKYASIYVDSTKCSEVGDVENHIKTVFKLDDHICLTNKKFLIPRSESIHILQQYDTLKVQKCDFYDYQIHKNKKSNPSCDNPALNLVQSDRTIDLSCRPKQRLQINICQKNCILESPTIFENGKSQNTIQSSLTLEENSLDQYIQTKNKAKNKKKKEEEINNDENATKILDMSFSKLKKKNKDDNFLIEEHLNQESPFNNVESFQESSNECKRKSKKRKKNLEVEDINLASSCWENLVADKSHDKKRKSRTNNFDKECNDSIAKDLSLNISSNQEVESEEKSPKMCVFEEISAKKKQKKEKKSRDSNDDKSTFQLTNVKHSNGWHKSGTNYVETDIINALTPKHLYCKGAGIEVKDDKILNQMDSGILCSNPMEVGQSPNTANSYKVTDDSQDKADYNKINGTFSDSGGNNLNSFQDSSNVKVKRKRKHNKKKKKERQEYLSAVGPLLHRIAALTEKETSSTSSELAKHVFFTDEDFIEDMKIPETSHNTSTSTLKGDTDYEKQHLPQDNIALNAVGTSDRKGLHDLLKLTTGSCKPLIFHRKVQPAISEKNDTPSNQRNEDSLKDTTPSDRNSSVKESLEGLNLKSEDVTIHNCDNRNNTEVDLKPDMKTLRITTDSTGNKPNVKNVVLTEYPIIDKVVAEDIILFKVLKLGENLEPHCSNTILAKVKETRNFPESISLLIIDGLEECNHLTTTIEDEGSIIELRWSEIVEPRLFYP